MTDTLAQEAERLAAALEQCAKDKRAAERQAVLLSHCPGGMLEERTARVLRALARAAGTTDGEVG